MNCLAGPEFTPTSAMIRTNTAVASAGLSPNTRYMNLMPIPVKNKQPIMIQRATIAALLSLMMYSTYSKRCAR